MRTKEKLHCAFSLLLLCKQTHFEVAHQLYSKNELELHIECRGPWHEIGNVTPTWRILEQNVAPRYRSLVRNVQIDYFVPSQRGYDKWFFSVFWTRACKDAKEIKRLLDHPSLKISAYGSAFVLPHVRQAHLLTHRPQTIGPFESVLDDMLALMKSCGRIEGVKPVHCLVFNVRKCLLDDLDPALIQDALVEYRRLHMHRRKPTPAQAVVSYMEMLMGVGVGLAPWHTYTVPVFLPRRISSMARAAGDRFLLSTALNPSLCSYHSIPFLAPTVSNSCW